MMGYYGWGTAAAANSWAGIGSLFGIITWIALIAFLISGTMFFWKNMKKGR